jgi:TetR/AcrR family acrAB operon transcriptional repressor
MARKTNEEAELCFLQHGVFRTTLEHIAARAGYTRGAVYWHFKNKLEVLLAVIDRVRVPLFSSLEEMTREREQPLLALRRHHDSALTEIEHTPHARNMVEITLLRCEFAEETEEVFAHVQRSAAQAIAHMTTTLQQARKLGHLRQGIDPATAARSIHFMIMGALRQWILNPKEFSVHREGMVALDMLFAGMATDAALDELKAAQPPARRKVRAG